MAYVYETDGIEAAKGYLAREIATGIPRFRYADTDFKIYQVSWVDEHVENIFFDFVFEHDYESELVPSTGVGLHYHYHPKNARNIATAHLQTLPIASYRQYTRGHLHPRMRCGFSMTVTGARRSRYSPQSARLLGKISRWNPSCLGDYGGTRVPFSRARGSTRHWVTLGSEVY